MLLVLWPHFVWQNLGGFNPEVSTEYFLFSWHYVRLKCAGFHLAPEKPMSTWKDKTIANGNPRKQ